MPNQEAHLVEITHMLAGTAGKPAKLRVFDSAPTGTANGRRAWPDLAECNVLIACIPARMPCQDDGAANPVTARRSREGPAAQLCVEQMTAQTFSNEVWKAAQGVGSRGHARECRPCATLQGLEEAAEAH